MKYAIALGTLAAAFALGAAALGGWGWLLLWPAADFTAVAAAYVCGAPEIFGKRPDGSWPIWRRLALLPFLCFAWFSWRLQRVLFGEPICSQVAPGLWIGGRPRKGDIPAGVGLVIDLTAEFPKARAIGARDYLTVPTLDGLATDESGLRRILAAAARRNDVLIHCAMGHGRSAMAAAAVMIERGLAGDIDSAERLLQQARPTVRFTKAQRARLRDWLESRAATPAAAAG